MPRSPRLAAGWARRQAGLPSRGHSRGFTLIELILVIVITAALAVFALPKVVDTTLWRLRAFGDELQSRHQAMLRLALQQRRPVVETLSATGVSWAYGNGTAIATLPCPATESPCISVAAPVSVTFNNGNSGATATSTGAALSVAVASGSYSQAYRIETDTGLIYPLP